LLSQEYLRQRKEDFKVLFDLRHEGDYEDFIDVDRLDIEEYTPQVRKLVEKLIHLIE